jgi:hypothetical protein
MFLVFRRDYHGCFDQLSPLIGLTFCGDLGFPYEGVPKKGPFFPLDGPAKLVVRVEKEDASLNGYHLHALYNNEGNFNAYFYTVLYTGGVCNFSLN